MKITCSATYILLLALVASTFASVANAAIIMVKGKTSSRVSATIIKPNRLFVNDINGGWYTQEMEMFQQGGANSPYQIELPLRITSSTGIFQVSLDQALILRHAQTPTLQFQVAEVSMANVDSAAKILSVGAPTVFYNTPSADPLQDTIGDYSLAISALPPEGDFKTNAGIYQGELRLTFEPVAKAVP
ncbi:hypothetical protein [Pragia fontium]|uniref:Fimbrial assembly protein n=2 Tax=Pragia fontium TaxID=82985 RepID=A0AAJ5BGI8_9GAMM|nr:hypothetical protein [Pragia fontium]GKX61965.1 hypothetical protein SOASR032_05340 [Pragia fontium]SFC45122.1 hypothetical protein SAMN02745723_102389 [Pragia fontium DSM 5563 = ATCC 49100]SUB82237.1 Uncharacterised protein [Pragia fontium]VEJ55004.1 Uncharacterised protein [Pragia fontium]